MQSIRRRTIPLIGLAGSLAVLSGCAEVPDLGASIPASALEADYPPLVPIETLLVSARPPDESASATQKELEARRDALQRRAERLNTPVVDSETEARMKAGVEE